MVHSRQHRRGLFETKWSNQMYEVCIKFCGAVFKTNHDRLDSVMETYKLLRRRNIREIIIRGPGNEMICGTGEFAAMWQVPEIPGGQKQLENHTN